MMSKYPESGRCEGCEHLVGMDGSPLCSDREVPYGTFLWNGVELGMCIKRTSVGRGMIHTEDSLACSGYERWLPA